MNFISQYTSDDPELSNLITQKVRSVDTEDLGFSGTINALGTGSLPTEGDIEKYLSSVSDDKPKIDTSAKDRRDRRQNQKRFKDAATKTLDTFARKEYETVKDIDDSKRLSTAFKNAKAVKEKLKQQEKGIITGFAKGGLASRRK